MMLTQNKNVLMLQGDWTIAQTARIEQSIDSVDFKQFDLTQTIQIDGDAIKMMDTSGAYWMSKFIKELESKSAKVELVKFHDETSALVEFITTRTDKVKCDELVAPPKDGFFVTVGKLAYDVKDQIYNFFDFIGRVSIVMAHNLMNPFRIRWKTLWSNVEIGGVQALFIIS